MKRKFEYDFNIYDFSNKSCCVKNEIDYMLIRCLQMFKYINLPDSVPVRTLELFLQTGGLVYWTDKPDGILRVFFGGIGGEPDEYYRPTLFTVANPYLNFSANLKIIWDRGQEGDGVLMLNDGLFKGLMPLHRKFATQIVENELSLKVSCVNSRMPFLLSADDERTRKSAEEYLCNIDGGKIGVINSSAFLEGIKEHQLGNQTHMVFQQLVEHNQYIRSTWYAQLGLNSMFNMKKEAISDAEKQMSEDELLPLIDDMLNERRRAIELVNEKYGTNIEVEFNSSWEDNLQEIELNHEVLEKEADLDERRDLRNVPESGGELQEEVEESEGESGESESESGSDIRRSNESSEVSIGGEESKGSFDDADDFILDESSGGDVSGGGQFDRQSTDQISVNIEVNIKDDDENEESGNS